MPHDNAQDVGTYMKAREQEYSMSIDSDKLIVARLDGASFSKLTERNYEKPFSPVFDSHMQTAVVDLMQAYPADIACGYTQSDEITLFFKEHSDGYNRRASKWLSLLSGVASSSFSRVSGLRGVFDCRILALDTVRDLYKCYQWRVDDCTRNALSNAVFWTMVHSGKSRKVATTEMLNMSNSDKEAYLSEHNITISEEARYGHFFYYNTYTKMGYNPIKQIDVPTERRKIAQCGYINDVITFLYTYHGKVKDYVITIPTE